MRRLTSFDEWWEDISLTYHVNNNKEIIKIYILDSILFYENCSKQQRSIWRLQRTPWESPQQNLQELKFDKVRNAMRNGPTQWVRAYTSTHYQTSILGNMFAKQTKLLAKMHIDIFLSVCPIENKEVGSLVRGLGKLAFGKNPILWDGTILVHDIFNYDVVVILCWLS